ncbi:MAG: hypothetical protein ABIP07_02155 [Sphingomicrobium sp.]
MSKKAVTNVNKVQVDVRASLDDNGGVHFDSLWRHENDPNGVWKSGPIDLPNGPDHYRMEFDLDDKSGRSLKFYADPAVAMYVNVGSCPTGSGNGGGQIDFESVTTGNKKLTIKDYNRNPPCALHYMLRFTGAASGACPPYKYDPEIKNGGGGE